MSPTELSELTSMKVEIGGIQVTLAAQAEDGKEHTAAIKDLNREIMKLTGNGSRGRIDKLAATTAENGAMLKTLLAAVEKLDKRQWSIWHKSAGWGGLTTGVIALVTAVVALL